MDLTGVQKLLGKRSTDPRPDDAALVCRVTRVGDDGPWVVPLGEELASPIGPCRGDVVVVDQLVLLVWTQERPWITKAAT